MRAFISKYSIALGNSSGRNSGRDSDIDYRKLKEARHARIAADVCEIIQKLSFTQQTADTYIGVIIITPTSSQGEEETFYVIRERLAEKILPMDVNTIRSSEYQDVKKCAEFELPSKNHFETFVYIQIMANIVGGCPLKLTKPKMNMRYPGDRQRFQDYKFVDATFRSS